MNGDVYLVSVAWRQCADRNRRRHHGGKLHTANWIYGTSSCHDPLIYRIQGDVAVLKLRSAYDSVIVRS